MAITTTSTPKHVVRIAEPVWRAIATEHSSKIREILQPGLLHPSQTATTENRLMPLKTNTSQAQWTALDPRNPVFNFLIEYYGLKGSKGPKRLARWSPDPWIPVAKEANHRIETLEEYRLLCSVPKTLGSINRRHAEEGTGVLLEGANEDDLSSVLHLKGAQTLANGMVYSPASFFRDYTVQDKKAASFLWYRSVLVQTLRAEPILHCHGLHEWAMQYQPEGAPPPPSAKYQDHLPLRVSREVINSAVERRGVSCTHVDALKYFAEAAGPLNHYGSSSDLERVDQLRLEQPACVHAQMDLLKICVKLQPFVDPQLLYRVLDISLAARRLDVAASPYDARSYGVGVIPIETKDGRAKYREAQTALMRRAEPIRKDLLNSYDVFLRLAFDADINGEMGSGFLVGRNEGERTRLVRDVIGISRD